MVSREGAMIRLYPGGEVEDQWKAVWVRLPWGFQGDKAPHAGPLISSSHVGHDSIGIQSSRACPVTVASV